MFRKQSRPVIRPRFAHLALTGLLALAGCALPQGELLVTAAPTISPAGGTFISAQTVTLTDTTPVATIFYTTDGTTPTTASPTYMGPISIARTEVLSAIAQAPQHEASPVVSASFTINIATPTPPTPLPTPQAATPDISPLSGTFTSAQTLTLTDTTPAAAIYFTLDGTPPTTASTVYAGPISVFSSLSVQAMAVAPGYSPSSVASAVFTIVPPPPSVTVTPTITPSGGSFIAAQSVTIADTTSGAAIYYTTDGSMPTLASSVYTVPVSILTSSTVQAIAVASGFAPSAVASATFTIKYRVATSAPTISPAGGFFGGVQTVSLADATPGATIFYTTDGSIPTISSPAYSASFTVAKSEVVRAVATASGATLSPVASAAFTISLSQAAAPVISPSGGSFSTVQTVSMTDTIANAVIYFTTDGSAPTTASAVYSQPFRVAQSETIRAMASAPGYTLSPVSIASLTIVVPPQPTLTGNVFMGKKPLKGASIELLSVGSTGYGSTGSVVSISSAISDANGDFTLPYICPDPASLVYLSSVGGQTTSAPIVGGNALVLATMLGPCGGLAQASGATLNELTTIATVFSLAQFLHPGSAPGGFTIGAPASNPEGLRNSVLTAMNLVGSATGALGSPSLPAGTQLPVSEMNTLADALASCVTSTSLCSGLFQATTASGANAPVDTLAAALRIALSPGDQVAAIYSLVGPGSPYQPILSTAPTDWALALRHTGGGLNNPTALAIDSSGNIWLANYEAAVSEFSPLGAALSPVAGFTGGGLNESLGLTIDAGGNVWVTNEESAHSVNGGNGSVTKLSSTGTILSGANGFGVGGLNFPVAAAADANGNVWIANYGNSTSTLLSPTGAAISPSGGFAHGQLSFPAAVAVTPGHRALLANSGGSTITTISPDGSSVAQTSCCNGPSGVALDQAGNVWVTNFQGESISEIAPSGTVLSAGYTGGELSGPQGIAVDGAGDVWVANYHGSSLTRLQGAGGVSPGTSKSGTLGFSASGFLSLPYALAIDASGSIWVSSSGSNALVQVLGAATPVKTPLIGLPAIP
jgi:streptogramin lyase